MSPLQTDTFLREANGDDIDRLALHHRLMFQEIWRKKGESLDQQTLGQLEQSYRLKLEEQMEQGTCIPWVVVRDQIIAASGAVTIISFVPTPLDPGHQIAYFHSLYTEQEYRGKGYARMILDQAKKFCREKGIRRIILTASEAGKPMYLASGFLPASDLMRLFLDIDQTVPSGK